MKHITKFELFEGKLQKATKNLNAKKPWDGDKKEDFRKKVESHIKSLSCTTKKIGSDLEIHCDGDHIGQVMFRDSYVGVKKKGVKFTNEFSYTEYGKIKSEITNIIKDCCK